jgi:hypothetical protein
LIIVDSAAYNTLPVRASEGAVDAITQPYMLIDTGQSRTGPPSGGASTGLQPPHVDQADPSAIADHDVVEDIDTRDRPGAHQAGCEREIVGARRGIATRVIEHVMWWKSLCPGFSPDFWMGCTQPSRSRRLCIMECRQLRTTTVSPISRSASRSCSLRGAS